MIAVIDSGVANLISVLYALARLGVTAEPTRDIQKIKTASHVILPGVGAAPAAMRELTKIPALLPCIAELRQPVLGICLGMQLLFRRSAEGEIPLLGIFPGEIVRLSLEDLVVPHMGWNRVIPQRDHPLFAGMPADPHFYFVHSYYAPLGRYELARTEYGVAFASVVEADNFIGCQFHPERSGDMGSQFLKNFIGL